MLILPIEEGDRVELTKDEDDISLTTQYIRFEILSIDRSCNEVTVKHYGQVDETETSSMGHINRVVYDFETIEIERNT